MSDKKKATKEPAMLGAVAEKKKVAPPAMLSGEPPPSFRATAVEHTPDTGDEPGAHVDADAARARDATELTGMTDELALATNELGDALRALGDLLAAVPK